MSIVDVKGWSAVPYSLLPIPYSLFPIPFAMVLSKPMLAKPHP
ncbi:hypothetical protein BJP36_44170 [Moorena producens JHB]|uniref:Uncharacterized protein n=1 Tax=Moorena producens (strain JHB) TaxID=1454205 RepID=A0A9Q9STI3_MOOP1|nr:MULTISPECIES: hypothetical protein [Moorena]WAN69358.1 hypothetical protein BJP36_44170 [Moorena producens JHB]